MCICSSKDIYKNVQSFPGGPVVKNPPWNARDTGLIPGPGRSPMPQGNWACVPQLMSLCSGACKLRLLKPVRPRACAPHKRSHLNGKPTHCNYRGACTRCKTGSSNKTQHNQKEMNDTSFWTINVHRSTIPHSPDGKLPKCSSTGKWTIN